MAKFIFRLQTLLRIREVERDERRADLAKAYEADQILLDRIKELDEQLQGNQQVYRNDTKPGMLNVERLIESQRQDLFILTEKQAVIQQRTTLEPEIDRRRLALVEADREVRVLEKLHEKHLQQHRENSAKVEGKQLDEIAGRRNSETEKQSWVI